MCCHAEFLQALSCNTQASSGRGGTPNPHTLILFLRLFQHCGMLKLNAGGVYLWEKVNAAPGLWQHDCCIGRLSPMSLWCRDAVLF